MVAATQARTVAVNINGQDYSQYFVSYEIGFDSYQQGTGLILKKGTLTLFNIQNSIPLKGIPGGNGRKLDPLDNDDFSVGNEVTILWDGKAHPLGYKTLILAPPEVSAINQSIPMIEGNLILSIPVGCRLSFYRTRQPDSDKTEVITGEYKTASQVVTNLLVASGIKPSEIFSDPHIYSNNQTLTLENGNVIVNPLYVLVGALFGGFEGANIGFPYSKNGGGFVDLAGEFAYMSRCSGRDTPDVPSICPTVLYCDTNNIVKACFIRNPSLIKAGILLIIGEGEKVYQRQLDQSIAPGIVTASSIRRDVVDITKGFPFTNTETDGQGGTITSTYYKAESDLLPSGQIFSLLIDGIIGVRVLNNYQFAKPSSWGVLGYYSYDGSYVETTQSSSQNFGLTCVTTVGRDWQYKFYNKSSLALDYEINARFVRAISLYPGGWDASDSFDKASRYSNRLVPSEIVVTQYFLTGSNVTKKIETTFSNLFVEDPSADFDDNFAWAFASNVTPFSYSLVVRKRVTEEWRQVINRWVYSIKEEVPRICNSPTFEPRPELNLDGQRAEKFYLEAKSTQTKNARDTVPPAPVYWTGKYVIDEVSVSDSVTFGTGTNVKNYEIQLPFSFRVLINSPPTKLSDFEPIDRQPQEFAKIEGAIVNARQYQYLLETSPDPFTNADFPLVPLRLAEPANIWETKYEPPYSGVPPAGVERFGFADALTWYHTSTETYVGMAAIIGRSQVSSIASVFPVLPEFDLRIASTVTALNNVLSIVLTTPIDIGSDYALVTGNYVYLSENSDASINIGPVAVTVSTPTLITIAYSIADGIYDAGGVVRRTLDPPPPPPAQTALTIPPTVSVTSGEMTINFASPHGLSTGDILLLSGNTSSEINVGNVFVTVVSPTQVTASVGAFGIPDGTYTGGGSAVYTEPIDPSLVKIPQSLAASPDLSGAVLNDGTILGDIVSGSIES